MIRASLFLLVLAMPAACTRFPEIAAADGARAAAAPYPRLIPLDGLLEGPQTRLDATSAPAMEARVAALRRRAAAIAPPVLTDEERA
ncbi:MAG: hypothetical protein WCD16_14845, partial [Paracoccaceae bacterium]